MASVGAVVAHGSRSIVHELGRDAVAKVPTSTTAQAWIRYEAEYSSAVRQAGAPVPEFLGFIEHEGRTSSVYRRARGPVMWEAIVADPASVTSHARTLAELQRLLATLVPPITVPGLLDRVRCKVRVAAAMVGLASHDVLAEVPRGARPVLCHGDLHPGNVILTTEGPSVVDWFDAGRGDPVADVARSLLLMSPVADRSAAPYHLAGGNVSLRRRLCEDYAEAAIGLGAVDVAQLERWRAVLAIARIAEGVGTAGLLEVWRTWSMAQGAVATG